MAPAMASLTPSLRSFLKDVSTDPVDKSIENFILLLKRGQIQGSKPCAIATAFLLRRVISSTRVSDPSKLIQKVHNVGKRIAAAQPREMAVGNIVRRVLGLIRDEEDEKRAESDFSGLSSEAGSEPQTPHVEITLAPIPRHLPPDITALRDPTANHSPTRAPLISSHTGGLSGMRPVTSMFSIISHPTMRDSGANSPANRSGTATPIASASTSDLRAEVMEGISELLDELDQSDEQIASYAQEHIHTNEIIFTYSASLTVQRFLLKAASKRKFTVIHAEGFPNHHRKTHALVTGNGDAEDDDVATDAFQKPLIAAGVTVILIPDSAIFALMSRANKVILPAHAVLSNGALVAAAGTKIVATAAKHYRVPVIVLAGTYQLSPKYPYDPDAFTEYGDVGQVVPFADADLRERVEIKNPVFDFVEPGCVDLFVTNLGGCATEVLYRVVREQYRDEDVDL
jgi:translation initiation factor eIF-2B subunit beta